MNLTYNDNDALADLNEKKIAEYGGALAYCVIVIVTGVLGNVMSIIFYGKRIHKTTTNALITYLATTDLIACVFFIDELIEICYTINFRSAIGCKLMSFFNHWIVITSGLMLCVICVDRYRKICCSNNWQFTQTKTKIIVMCVVLFSCMTAVRNFVILDVVQFNITVPYSDEPLFGYYCTHTKDDDLKQVVTGIFIFDILLYVIIMVILLLLYAFVAREIWRVHRLLKQHESQSSVRYMNHGCSVNKNYHMHESNEESDTSNSNVNMSYSDADSSDTKTSQPIKSDLLENPSKLMDNRQNEPNGNSSVVSEVSTSSNGMRCSETDDTNTDQTSSQRDKSDSLELQSITMDIRQNKQTGALNINSMSRNKKDSLASNRGTIRTHHHSHGHHIERQISVMMIIITIVSVLSYVPYFIVTMTTKRSSNTPEHEFSVGIQIALRSFMLNNAVNPYIMGIFNTKFRQFVTKSFCRLCPKKSTLEGDTINLPME